MVLIKIELKKMSLFTFFFFAKIIFDANDSKRKVKTSCCYCRFLSCKKRFKDTHSETKPLLKIQIYAKSMKRYEDLGFKS